MNLFEYGRQRLLLLNVIYKGYLCDLEDHSRSIFTTLKLHILANIFSLSIKSLGDKFYNIQQRSY